MAVLVSIISNGVDKTNREIDEIVYRLYGITDKRTRKVIEGVR